MIFFLMASFKVFLSYGKIVKLPKDVQELLNEASRPRKVASAVPAFKCQVFAGPWDQFVELWAPRVYTFVTNALGSYQQEPLPQILALPDGMHSAGATASFDPSNGQVRLATSVEGKPGQTLEKLTHEFIHASLAHFPEGDPFYEEGQVDYATWLMAHAPVWQPYRDQMIDAAAFNISQRRDRALRGGPDYDRKRWAGGLFAMTAYGPHLISRLRGKKLEGDLTW